MLQGVVAKVKDWRLRKVTRSDPPGPNKLLWHGPQLFSRCIDNATQGNLKLRSGPERHTGRRCQGVAEASSDRIQEPNSLLCEEPRPTSGPHTEGSPLSEVKQQTCGRKPEIESRGGRSGCLKTSV